MTAQHGKVCGGLELPDKAVGFFDQEQHQLHQFEFRLDTRKAGQSLIAIFTLEGGPVRYLKDVKPWILKT